MQTKMTSFNNSNSHNYYNLSITQPNGATTTSITRTATMKPYAFVRKNNDSSSSRENNSNNVQGLVSQ